MGKNKRKWIIAGILLLLGLAYFIFPFLFKKSLSYILSLKLGAKVSISSLKVSPSKIEAENIFVKVKNKDILKVGKLFINYNLNKFGRHGFLGSIEKIKASSLEMNISREGRAEWNFNSLNIFKEKQKKNKYIVLKNYEKKRFSGTIEVRDAKIDIYDGFVSKGKTTLFFNFKSNHKLHEAMIDLRAKDRLQNGARISASGTFDYKGKNTDIEIKAANLKLANSLNYFFIGREFLASAGEVDISARIIDKNFTPYFSGNIFFKDAGFVIQGIPYELKNINGSAVVKGSSLYSDRLNGAFGEIPIYLSGEIKNIFDSYIKLRIVSGEFDLYCLKKFWEDRFKENIRGTATGLLLLEGPWWAAEYDCSIASRQAKVGNKILKNSKLDFRFMGDVFYIPSFLTHWRDGRISMRGWYFFGKPESVLLHLRTQGIKVFDFFGSKIFKSPASIGSDFTILGNPENPFIFGQGSLKELFGEEKRASFLYQDKVFLFSLLKKKQAKVTLHESLEGFGYFDFKEKLSGLYLKGDNIGLAGLSMGAFKNITGKINFQTFLAGRFDNMRLLFLMKDSSIGFENQNFDKINLTAAFDGRNYFLDNSSANYNMRPLNFSGVFGREFTAFLLEAKGISIAKLRKDLSVLKYLPLSKDADIDFSLAGTSKEGYFCNFHSKSLDERVSFKGFYKTGSIPSGVSLISGSNLKFDKDLKVSGTFNAESLIFKEENNINVYGDISFLNGKVFKFPVDFACFHFNRQGRGFQLENFGVRGQSGSLKLYGTAGGRNFDLSYSLANIDSKKLKRAFNIPFLNQLNILGAVNSSGRIKGTVPNPSIEGNLWINQAVSGFEQFDLFSRFSFFNNNIKLFPLKIIQAEGVLSLNGTVRLAKIPGFNFEISAEKCRLDKLLGLTPLNSVDISGLMDSQLRITGDIKNPSINGKLSIADADIYNQPVKILAVEVNSSGRKFNLKKMFLKFKEGQFSGSGLIDSKGMMSFSFDSNNFPLEELPFLSKALGKVKGFSDFKLEVSGNTKNPKITGEISANDVEIKEEKFDLINGIIAWQKNSLFFNPFKLTFADEVYQLTGRIFFPGGKIPVKISQWVRADTCPELNLQFETVRGELSKILGLFGNHLKDKISGKLTSTISINGKLSSPEVKVSSSISKGSLGNSGFESLDIAGDYKDFVFEIGKLNFLQAQGSLSAYGRLNFKGESNVSLLAKNLDISLVSPFLRASHSMEGFMDLDLKFSGQIYRPDIKSNFNVKKIKFGSVAFDNFSGRITGSNGYVSLEDLQLKKDKHKAKAYGKFPFIWKKGEFYTSAEIDLNASFNEEDLSLLNIFGDIVNSSSGTFAGSFKVSGPLNEVNFTGNAAVKGGRADLKFLDNPIEDLNVNISLAEDKLEVKDFHGRMGAGSFKLSGDVGFIDFYPEKINLKAFMDSILVIAPPYFRGNVSGNLGLSGTLKEPLLSGKIDILDGSIDLHSFGDNKINPAGKQEKISSLMFYLDVALERVWLNNRSAAVQTFLKSNGILEFRGTLPMPTLGGRIDFSQGDITFYNTTFKVKDGVAYFDGTTSWDPSIDLTAQTTIGSTIVYIDISGNINRPVWEATSDPPLTRDEILGIVAGKVFPLVAQSGIEAAPQDRFSQYLVGTLQATLLQPLIQSLGRSFEFGDVSFEYALPGYWILKFAKAIDKDEKFFVTYSRVFGNNAAIQLQFKNIFGLEYKLQRRMVVRVERNEYGEYNFGIQARYQY